jgi:hypothetical protein
MESYIQLTPLNNYLSNCVIKLHMKLFTPNLPLNNCVIKLHISYRTNFVFCFLGKLGGDAPKIVFLMILWNRLCFFGKLGGDAPILWKQTKNIQFDI